MNHQRNNGNSATCGASDGRLVRDRGKVDCPECLALPVPVMGRPARAGAAATRYLKIRATDDELARWRTAAGDEPISEWARRMLSRNARDRDVY